MHRLPIGRLILAAIAAALGWWWWSSRPLTHAPGVLVSAAPMQAAVPPLSLGERNGFQLTAVAKYTARGRVLGTKRYHSGLQTALVPVDVAIGWSRMSDQAVLDHLDITMGNRFFFYHWQNQPPIPTPEIVRSASNNHVVAASDTVRSVIGKLRVGSIVEMEGWLVNADGPNGFRWRSSLKRDDTGNGACELFYVEKIQAWNTPPVEPAAPPISPVPS